MCPWAFSGPFGYGRLLNSFVLPSMFASTPEYIFPLRFLSAWSLSTSLIYSPSWSSAFAPALDLLDFAVGSSPTLLCWFVSRVLSLFEGDRPSFFLMVKEMSGLSAVFLSRDLSLWLWAAIRTLSFSSCFGGQRLFFFPKSDLYAFLVPSRFFSSPELLRVLRPSFLLHVERSFLLDQTLEIFPVPFPPVCSSAFFFFRLFSYPCSSFLVTFLSRALEPPLLILSGPR